MRKPPYRLKFEDRGYHRRVWVAYLESDGSQWLVFAPGEYLRSVLHTIHYYSRVLINAQQS